MEEISLDVDASLAKLNPGRYRTMNKAVFFAIIFLLSHQAQANCVHQRNEGSLDFSIVGSVDYR